MITYYTDFHDVDEDLKTFPTQGGYWIAGNMAGIVDRPVSDTVVASIHIASRKNKWLILEYRRTLGSNVIFHIVIFVTQYEYLFIVKSVSCRGHNLFIIFISRTFHAWLI